MLKRLCTLAIATIALAAPGTYALAQSVLLSSNSNNGSGIAQGGGASTVAENPSTPPGYAFDIFGVLATRTGNNLTVTIYTNYANNVGQLNTGLGYLFFGNGSTATTYAASINYNGTGGPNSGTVYQPGSNIQNSFYGNANGGFSEPSSGIYPTSGGNVPSTTSCSNGGCFNPGQPVGVTSGAAPLAGSYGVTETWQVVTGTQVLSHDQAAGNFGNDGKIIFTLNNVFDTSATGLDLGGADGVFSIAWSMTCANDYIVDTYGIGPTTQSFQVRRSRQRCRFSPAARASWVC